MTFCSNFVRIVIIGVLASSVTYGHASSFLTPEVFYENKIVIDREYDLGGKEIILPPNSMLVFKKNGKLKNGKLVGSNTTIHSSHRVIFDKDIVFAGTFSSAMEYEWLYESSCKIVKKQISVYNDVYNVKTAEGLNQWDNLKDVFKRVVGAFNELHFNKDYVLDHPKGIDSTNSNRLIINTHVVGLKIRGGCFHNAGLCFIDWHNIEFDGLKFYGKYYDYSRRELSLTWKELAKENGQQLNYCSEGLSLTSPYNADIINTKAYVHDVETNCCYNGIYIGRWSGKNNNLISVKNVKVENCRAKNSFYHGFASVNCDSVIFDRCNTVNTYLGMLVDISHGSQNVHFTRGKGKGLGTPFKIQGNPLFPHNKNCSITDCYVTVERVVDMDDPWVQCIALSGEGNVMMRGNTIRYKGNSGNTMLGINEFYNGELEFCDNVLYGLSASVLVRVHLSSSVEQNDNRTKIIINNNKIVNKNDSKETMHFLLLDEKGNADSLKVFLEALVSNNRIKVKSGLQDGTLCLLRSQGKNGNSLYCNAFFEKNRFVVDKIKLEENLLNCKQFILSDVLQKQ